MAKGIKAAPKKRKKKRLSEHARLVEERARSIPPGVVHELFDTSTLPIPPPAPHRHAAQGRLVSKPPPPPPRPSHAPEDAEEAELEELDGSEELVEVDGSEESQSDGFGSHTISPSAAPGSLSDGAVRGRSQRSRALPAVLAVGIVGTLALVTGRELGRSQSVAPRPEPRAAAPAARVPPEPAPALPSPPGPVADDLPLLPPGVTAAPTAEPPSEVAEEQPPASHEEGAVAAPLAEAPTELARLAQAVSPAASAKEGMSSEPAGLPVFDAAMADAAIQAAFQRAQGCRSATDAKGSATVTLTYAPSGRVTTALVSGIYAGTSIGSCIAAALRSARIEPFTGALVTVKRTAALN